MTTLIWSFLITKPMATSLEATPDEAVLLDSSYVLPKLCHICLIPTDKIQKLTHCPICLRTMNFAASKAFLVIPSQMLFHNPHLFSIDIIFMFLD